MRNEKIEDIITNFGPFDQSVNISADRKMTTCKRDKLTYYVNINTDETGFPFPVIIINPIVAGHPILT